MHFSKEANGAVRRFIASSAATIQSRKKLRLAHGLAPSAAEGTHGLVLTAKFSQHHTHSTKADDVRHSRTRQIVELENVWEAKAIIDLCPNDYCFYCRREGISEEVSRLWEDLAFNNPKCRGVFFQNVPKADAYPVLSDPSIPLKRFTDLRDSPVPVVLNYSEEMISTALDRIKKRMPSIGMSVEMSLADGHNPSDFSFPTTNDNDNDATSTFPHAKADSLYHSIKAYAGSMSKRNPDDPMRREIEHVLAELEVKAMLRADGKYTPPTAEELSRRPVMVAGLCSNKSARSASDDDGSSEEEEEGSSQYMSFCSQVPTTATSDKRIPQSWE